MHLIRITNRILVNCTANQKRNFFATTTTQAQVPQWSTAVNEAEKMVGYPTSFLNLRWLLNDELANVAMHLRKLIGSDHPLLQTARGMFIQTDLPAWGLIVLLVSKAAGLNSRFPEVERDVAAGVLYSQRALAEITEMIYKSTQIHKCLVNFKQTDEDSGVMNFGNKMALLSGDYLLCKSYHQLACLKNQEVNELVSSALRDLVDCEFIPPRDQQNLPLPAKPNKNTSPPDLFDPSEFGSSPRNVGECLGNARQEWILRNTLGGGSLLGKSCQGAFNLAGHSKEWQEKGYLFGKHLALGWQACVERAAFANGVVGPASLVSAPVLFHLQTEPGFYGVIERGLLRVEDVDYGVVRKEVSSGVGLAKTKELQVEHALVAREIAAGFPEGDAKEAIFGLVEVLIKN